MSLPSQQCTLRARPTLGAFILAAATTTACATTPGAYNHPTVPGNKQVWQVAASNDACAAQELAIKVKGNVHPTGNESYPHGVCVEFSPDTAPEIIQQLFPGAFPVKYENCSANFAPISCTSSAKTTPSSPKPGAEPQYNVGDSGNRTRRNQRIEIIVEPPQTLQEFLEQNPS